MAEQIHDSGSGYYNPQARRFQPTLQIPMLESPALRGFVQDEMGRIQEDTKNVQQNISKFRKVKDMATGLDLSPKNLEMFEQIRSQRYDINDDLGNLRPEEFANPVMMDAMENKMDRLFKDPEVKRILGSEAYADKFLEKTFQIGDASLREKAKKDYEQALDGGYEDMLSLNIEAYKPMDPNKDILQLSKNLPEERLMEDRDGFRYTYDKITDDGLENLKKQMEYKYKTDAQFRNNFDVQYGDRYESVAEYIDNLSEQGAFLDVVGKPAKLSANDTSEGTGTFNDYRKNATKNQKDVLDMYATAIGKGLGAPMTEDVAGALNEIAAEFKIDNLTSDKLLKEVNTRLNKGEEPEADRMENLQEEGKWMNAEGNILDVEDVGKYRNDLDMATRPGTGNYDEYFGEGTKQSLKKGMRGDYKGKVDEDGNLLTSNARWVYEDYLGQSQATFDDDVEQLKSMVDGRDDIEFVKASKGIPAHFKIKGKEVKKEPKEKVSTEDVDVGKVTTFPTDRGEARTGVPKGYSSSKANNPFNVRPGSNSNTFNVYETMAQGFKDGMKLLDRYYEGKNTSLRDNKERYFDSKGEPVTLQELVYTWSPPENMAKELGKGETGNTQEAVDNYLSSVAKNLGVSEDTKLQDIDKEALALEMVRVECPKCYDELVNEADSPKENAGTEEGVDVDFFFEE